MASCLAIKVGQDLALGLPAAPARRGPGRDRPCAQPARRRTGAADAGEAAAGHLEDAALPDAGRWCVASTVAEGDEVEDGQTLAIVEAMKMENVLRAERKGTVKRVAATAGASLAVDEVIMEFE